MICGGEDYLPGPAQLLSYSTQQDSAFLVVKVIQKDTTPLIALT